MCPDESLFSSACRHKLTFAHHVWLVPDIFVDNAIDYALRNLKISRYNPYGLWKVFINNALDLLYKLWCLNMLYVFCATLSTLSSDTSNSRRTLWTNDRTRFKNMEISRLLWFACIAMITACLFIFWISLLFSIYDLKGKKKEKYIAAKWQAHMWAHMSSNTWRILYIIGIFRLQPIRIKLVQPIPRSGDRVPKNDNFSFSNFFSVVRVTHTYKGFVH